MTAVGLVLVLYGLGVPFAEALDARIPDWVKLSAGVSLLIGALLIAAGSIVKIWQVMP